LKEKNMKKNLMVLVLLVTWILLSFTSLPPVAFADEGQIQVPGQGNDQDEIIVPGNGADDDDSGGDPGDAGDGYGSDLNEGKLGELDGVDDSKLDEFLQILMSLIQLAI
jgi:hypothetical protein